MCLANNTRVNDIKMNETGRWYNISRNDRLCHLCDSIDIGDEFHYVMTCSFFENERKYYLPYYCQKNANILKFNQGFIYKCSI